MFHKLHLILAFGRWERLREPGLVFLYVLPLVYWPRSEQAGYFIFYFFYFLKRRKKKNRSPSIAKTRFLQDEFRCQWNSLTPIGPDSTEPAPLFSVNLTVLIPNFIFRMQLTGHTNMYADVC